MGKLEEWFTQEEKYFLDKFGLPIEPGSYLASFVFELHYRQLLSKVISEAKYRQGELLKCLKQFKKNIPFIRNLKAVEVASFYTMQSLFTFPKATVGPDGEILGGGPIQAKQAREIYSELSSLTEKINVVLEEAITIQNQIINKRPPKQGGQKKDEIVNLLEVLSCIICNGEETSWKDIRRLLDYYVARDPAFDWIKELTERYKGKDQYNKNVSILRTRLKTLVSREEREHIREIYLGPIGKQLRFTIVAPEFKHLTQK